MAKGMVRLHSVAISGKFKTESGKRVDFIGGYADTDRETADEILKDPRSSADNVLITEVKKPGKSEQAAPGSEGGGAPAKDAPKDGKGRGGKGKKVGKEPPVVSPEQ